MKDILDYLKKSGESLDIDIALATGLPLLKVHQQLTELTSKGEVMTCHATRYEEGEKIEVLICRLVGHGPAKRPGKKAKPMLELL